MKSSSVFFLTLALCSVAPAHSQESRSLVLSQTISLPNVQGGFNHMSVDVEHMRLFVAAPTDNTLEIVDLKTGKPWRTLEGGKPPAVRYAPEFNQLYVPRGQSLDIYDGKTLNPIASIDLGSNMDELQYNARAKRLYVACMAPDKTGIAVIAIPEGKLLGKIPLPAKLQGVAVEQKGSRIFANNCDRRAPRDICGICKRKVGFRATPRVNRLYAVRLPVVQVTAQHKPWRREAMIHLVIVSTLLHADDD